MRFAVAVAAGEEGEQQRCSMEGAVAAGVGLVRDEAEPSLVDEGGTDEARGIFWWEDEEDR